MNVYKLSFEKVYMHDRFTEKCRIELCSFIFSCYELAANSARNIIKASTKVYGEEFDVKNWKKISECKNPRALRANNYDVAYASSTGTDFMYFECFIEPFYVNEDSLPEKEAEKLFSI